MTTAPHPRYTWQGRVLLATTWVVIAGACWVIVYGVVAGLLWMGWQLALLLDAVLDAVRVGW